MGSLLVGSGYGAVSSTGGSEAAECVSVCSGAYWVCYCVWFGEE